MLDRNCKLWRSYERNVRLAPLRSFLGGAFGAFGPVVFSVWEGAGLSTTECSLLETVFLVVFALGVIPGGFLADSIGRVLCIRISAALSALSLVLYGVAGTFWHFLTAEVVIATGFCFGVGAESALLRGSLEALGESDRYGKINGRARLWSGIGFASFSLLGGMLGKFDLRLPLWCAALALGLSALIAFLLCEPKSSTEQGERPELSLGAMRKMVSDSLVQNQRVRWLLAFGAFLWAWQQTAMFFFQPALRANGLGVETIGMLFAAMSLINGFVAFKTTEIHQWAGEHKAFTAVVVSGAGACLILGMFSGAAAVFAVALLRIGVAYGDTALNNTIKDEVPTQRTASVLSIQVSGGRISEAAVLPLAGTAVGNFGLFLMFLGLGVLVLLVGAMILRANPARRGESL